MGRLQPAQVVDGQRQLRVGAQLRPFVAGEAAERRLERLKPSAIHQNSLTRAGALGRIYFPALFVRDAFSSSPLCADRLPNSSMTDDSATPRALSTTSRW